MSQTVGVISVPEITTHTIKENDCFIIWASDGVWEFVTDEAAVKLLWKHKDNLQEAANQLAEESTKMWKKGQQQQRHSTRQPSSEPVTRFTHLAPFPFCFFACALLEEEVIDDIVSFFAARELPRVLMRLCA